MEMSRHANNSKYVTNLAKGIIDAMIKRKAALFDNPIMVAALFLDPRYRSEICQDENKVLLAKATLGNIWEKAKAIHQGISVANDETDEPLVISDTDDQCLDEELNLAVLFDRLDKKYKAEDGLESDEIDKYVQSNDDFFFKSKYDIMLLCENFNPLNRLKSGSSVVEFWETQIAAHPELHFLATIIYAINPTEVEIERDFSGLGHIFNEKRCNLSESLLADTLLLHLNSELFKIITKKHIDELDKPV